MKKTYLILSYLIPSSAFSQKTCAFSYDYNSQPLYLRQIINSLSTPIEGNYRAQSLPSSNIRGEAVLMIPVVVHVVYQNTQQNVSDDIIKNQIKILNDDYRRRNADRTSTPAAFAGVAADTKIQFSYPWSVSPLTNWRKQKLE